MADVDAAKIDAPKAPKDEAPKSSALQNEARDTMMAGFPKAENMTNQVNQWDLGATKYENYPVLQSETATLDLSVPIDSNAKPGEQKKDAPAAKPAATQDAPSKSQEDKKEASNSKVNETEDAPSKSQENKKEAPTSKVNETEDAPAKSQENKTQSFKLNAVENHRRTPEEQKRETSKPESARHWDEDDQGDERKEKPASKTAEAQHQKYEAESADKARQTNETKSAEANQKKETQSVEENRKKEETKPTDTTAQKHDKLDTIAEINAFNAKHAAEERHTMNQAATVVEDLPKLSLEGDLKVAGAFAGALFGTMAENIPKTAEAIVNSFDDGVKDQGTKLKVIGELCEDIGNGKFEKGLGITAQKEFVQLGKLAQDYEEHPTATALRQLAELTQELSKGTQATLTTFDRIGNEAMYDPEQLGLNGVRMIPEMIVDGALAVATAGTGDEAVAAADESADAATPELETAAKHEIADAAPSEAAPSAEAPETPEPESEPSEEGGDDDEAAHKLKEGKEQLTKMATGHESHKKETKSEKEQKEAGKLLHPYLPKMPESAIDVEKIAGGHVLPIVSWIQGGE